MLITASHEGSSHMPHGARAMQFFARAQFGDDLLKILVMGSSVDMVRTADAHGIEASE